MAIGYACLAVGVDGTRYKTCRKDNAEDENLKKIITHNLKSLDRILDYNIENGIKLMRISSDIIPFGSHTINKLNWSGLYEEELFHLGEKAKKNNIRLSMHPGQYTVLNSPKEEVVKNAIEDLKYHAKFLDSLDLGSDSKIILHIGGAYGNKKEALQRFGRNYIKLNQNIKNRLVIENDDKIFNIEEVLGLGVNLNIPVIYDNLHNFINPANANSDAYWVKEVSKTWKNEDGRQKIHYSQQDRDKKPGSHSSTINIREFLKFYQDVYGDEIDIMLEVKDKNLSTIKCINAVEKNNISELEKEWARYKYLILEHSPNIYKEIRELLKDKSAYPVEKFYELIDNALLQTVLPNCALNAAQHIWGYFSDDIQGTKRDKLLGQIKKISNDKNTLSIKKTLWKLSKEYKRKYLLQSLYFKDVI